ncbi:hypothetical protein ACOBQJ_14820 [Pelotomaculum propionicicum]|uniref:hypothetical protein n=1 Tax=Pelotomaculum propionicicum TaxID=258475 RepID=UPI003B7B1ECB
MKYIWLIIMVVIILRSVGRLMERSGYRGKFELPRKELPYDEDDLFLESAPAGEPGEGGSEADLPGFPAGRGGGGDLTAAGDVPRTVGMLKEPAGQSPPERGRDVGSRRELDGRCGAAELFEGGISQREFIKGMVWSQILGPRGGIQASKRFKYR